MGLIYCINGHLVDYYRRRNHNNTWKGFVDLFIICKKSRDITDSDVIGYKLIMAVSFASSFFISCC